MDKFHTLNKMMMMFELITTYIVTYNKSEKRGKKQDQSSQSKLKV